LPQPDELLRAEVEPICRKYLELRYRLLPHLYSPARECTKTGLPVMRALWLPYPDDPAAARAAMSVSGAAISSLPWLKKEPCRAGSISRAVPGTTSGPASPRRRA
jgi:hypothetical protein